MRVTIDSIIMNQSSSDCGTITDSVVIENDQPIGCIPWGRNKSQVTLWICELDEPLILGEEVVASKVLILPFWGAAPKNWRKTRASVGAFRMMPRTLSEIAGSNWDSDAEVSLLKV